MGIETEPKTAVLLANAGIEHDWRLDVVQYALGHSAGAAHYILMDHIHSLGPHLQAGETRSAKQSYALS